MKKELCLFVLRSFFITLICLDAQIRAVQTWYTVVSFGFNPFLKTLGARDLSSYNSGTVRK